MAVVSLARWSDAVERWNGLSSPQRRARRAVCAAQGHDRVVCPVGPFCRRCLELFPGEGAGDDRLPDLASPSSARVRAWRARQLADPVRGEAFRERERARHRRSRERRKEVAPVGP